MIRFIRMSRFCCNKHWLRALDGEMNDDHRPVIVERTRKIQQRRFIASGRWSHRLSVIVEIVWADTPINMCINNIIYVLKLTYLSSTVVINFCHLYDGNSNRRSSLTFRSVCFCLLLYNVQCPQDLNRSCLQFLIRWFSSISAPTQCTDQTKRGEVLLLTVVCLFLTRISLKSTAHRLEEQ